MASGQNDPQPDVRREAVAAIVNYHEVRVADALLAVSNREKDNSVRLRIFEVCGQTRDARFIDHLLPMLSDSTWRFAAVKALGEIGESRALPPIMEILKTQQQRVAEEAYIKLRYLRPPK